MKEIIKISYKKGVIIRQNKKETKDKWHKEKIQDGRQKCKKLSLYFIPTNFGSENLLQLSVYR